VALQTADSDKAQDELVDYDSSGEGPPHIQDAVRRVGERVRQSSMLAQHPEMDEHAAMVQETVQDLASRFPVGSEISLGVKVPYELVTDQGQYMDAKITVKVDVKPQKEKE
jgi:hypothetical protein